MSFFKLTFFLKIYHKKRFIFSIKLQLFIKPQLNSLFSLKFVNGELAIVLN